MANDQSNIQISAVLEANFAGGYGGGLASVGVSSVLLQNGVIFRSNYALGNGGGLFAAGQSTTIGEIEVDFLVCRIS
jgi:predicted outer membrane repeat protein